MRLRRLTILLAVLLLLVGPATAQGPQVVAATFTALSATGQTSALNTTSVAPSKHTVQVNVTGSPATCTIQFEGSLDNSTWFDLSGAITCTSNTMFHVVNKPVNFVRGNLTALTGGTNPTVTARYVGIR